jgi:hypothetical protein
MNSDPINPSHYLGPTGKKCHEVQKDVLGPGMKFYWLGCILKYLFRYDKKNGIQDLEKAIRCIRFLIEEIQCNVPSAESHAKSSSTVNAANVAKRRGRPSRKQKKLSSGG